jgi:hypothetical protein
MSVIALYREPFGFEPRVDHMPNGTTLEGMRQRVRGLPDDFAANGVICINGHPAPRAAWGMIKPKPTAGGVPVVVTFHAPMLGGGGDSGGKNILMLIAAIGLTIATGFIAGGALQGVFGAAFASGAIGAKLAAAGVSLIGALLINSLAPPPAARTDSKADAQIGRYASIQGNIIEPNGATPRVLGERRYFPPFAAEPLITLDGEDEVVEAVYALAGPHRIGDIRIGAAPIESVPGVEFAVREGWPGTTMPLINRRYGRTDALQSELRGHVVSDSDAQRLQSDIDVSLAVPQAAVVATRQSPDEHQLQIMFPQGLIRLEEDEGDAEGMLRVPFRLRMRQVGSGTWINLPEIHWRAADARQMRGTIRFVWGSASTDAPSISGGKGWVGVFTNIPAQTAAPAAPGYVANSYFYASGPTYTDQSNLGTTGVRNISADRFTLTFWLNEAVFPRGQYEIEAKRGCAVRDNDWVSSAYTTGGNVRDLFGYTEGGVIPYTRKRISDTVAILRSVSIWNSDPVQGGECAIIAIKARNQMLDRVSALCGGYVRDWSGSAWSDWVVTSNPAPHLRDIYTGRQNMDPVPDSVIDEDAIVEWRTRCATEGYEVNAVVADGSVLDAAMIVCGNGYARPYMSEVWGVVQDYDRSAEAPVQVFTPRNSRGFSWNKSFVKTADALRVNYADEAQNFEIKQMLISRPGASADTGMTEQVTYEGTTSEALARARALYDLAQPEVRGTTYSLVVPPEAIICRRGSLVGVVHDSLSAEIGFGRVIAGGPDGVILDDSVPLVFEDHVDDVADFDAVLNVDLLGINSAAVIRRGTGAVDLVPLTGVSGSTATLTFAAPVDPVSEGDLVSVGPLHRELLRLVVLGITPGDELEATLTLVDEAAELFAA